MAIKSIASTSEINTNPLMRISLSEYFARDQYALPTIHRLQDVGIVSVGDLISKTEKEILSSVRMTSSNKEKIANLVKGFGLSFANPH
jgi:hypothetical protein